MSRPTVLVLGAGASCPYGFPTGRQLVREIVEACLNPSGIPAIFPGDIETSAVVSFGDALKRSGPSSVDSFLEHRTNPAFREVGRCLIAWRLLAREKDDGLFNAKPEEDWYQYLWEFMTMRRGRLDASKLAIITFNYERSFERFFLERLKALRECSEDEAFQEFSAIEIVHVYGSLGDARCRELPYGLGRVERHHVATAARNLEVMVEGKDTSEAFAKAFELLSSAKVICFLGFGFHPDNVRRLRLSDFLQKEPRRWFASRYDMTDTEFHRLLGPIAGKFIGTVAGKIESVGDVKDNCWRVLRDLPVLKW